MRSMRGRWTALCTLLGLVLATAAPAAAAPGAATAAVATEDGRSYTGTIDGADFRVEVPAQWNGTLVLFSHGYYPPGMQMPPGVALSTHSRTEQWLLEHGYALAASDFTGRTGFVVEDALQDQVAVLDWFDEHVGTPETTVSSGMSMGGGIAAKLSELRPRRFDGVLTVCAEYDFNASWNTALDIAYVIRTLLAPGQDIDLVEARDPARSTELLLAAIDEATTTELGRARLALAGAIGNVPGWYSTPDPEPTDLGARLRQQLDWIRYAYVMGLGPAGRGDLEARAGGNPSWNTGVNYRRLFAHSARRDLAVQAYGGDRRQLAADLRSLAAAPRISADPQARRAIDELSVRGTTPAPVLTVHNTGDGGALPDQQGWYARQVRRNGDRGDLRQLWVQRGNHCAFSAADEIVALRTLLQRVQTGRWGPTSPSHLNAAVSRFDDRYERVLDFAYQPGWALPPAFTEFRPPRSLRPSF
ncbi:hypothetical protein CLV30_103249 [Haloactinopolyspora alba]|uniref:Uncharacterized protein n=1 Tax=Haloactinopolyspora alba TaxID=648780 RepID=A0A2P8E9G8_9ACTN|nr:hypothetical protein [Haloactinopolyspora alba]PSL06094.1 hypothetical protein CLV30_103249 [Haloactinopolyspora alba]